MADVTVTGLTAARMKEIEAASIVDADMDGDGNLTLITRGGQRIELGTLKGPKGDVGPGGSVTTVNGKTGSSITLAVADIAGAVSTADLAAATTPSGTIVMTGRTAAPSGWMLCQGQAVSRSTYSALYSALGVAYGAGDGSTTFNLPNLKGRVPVGRDTATGSKFANMGATGGTTEETLSIGQMPVHSHGLTNTTAVATNRAYMQDPLTAKDNGWGSLGAGLNGSRFNLDVDIKGTITNTGNGQSHNNLQPYQVVNYMIKV